MRDRILNFACISRLELSDKSVDKRFSIEVKMNAGHTIVDNLIEF